ncbi:MAG TPA: MerR family transcriptional regulator [Acidimicrobiales bacterium]|nr:MerR family transcriptional regulator [Acidimicrobiales bacterium]
MTVDQVARAAGTTTRHVRALQSHGVLPHPHLVGRTGYYDGHHLERLRAVLRLQDEGFSIAAIAALLHAWESGATLAQVLGLPPRGRVASERDAADFFDGWPAGHKGRLLSVVPTTVLAPSVLAPSVLEQPAAS